MEPSKNVLDYVGGSAGGARTEYNRRRLQMEVCRKMNTDVMFSSKTDQWATPHGFFNKLNDEFHFDLDPCADAFNHKCDRYFTESQDGLAQDWTGARVFCNPPYGREIGRWVEKCATGKTEIAVMLIPARTDTKWFHDYIYGKAEVRFIRGRLKFGDSRNSAPFPSMVVVFRRYADAK